MMKIILDMILCKLLDYHIICRFRVQIRFPAVTDLLLPTQRHLRQQTCGADSAADDTICCVIS
ncbi:hypothetical protein DKG79_24340 (plasmid) [Escherichia fergusonii]|nr:hypothetical protein DKG79_24340 [Escherichia fergusonii]